MRVWERERKEEKGKEEEEGGEISAALYTSVVASIPSLLRLAICRWWPTEQLLQVGGGTQRHSMGTRVFFVYMSPLRPQ